MSTLRWKKQPLETGLSSIARDSQKRSSNLHDGTYDYASVYHHDYSYTAFRMHGKSGCYWVAFGPGIPYVNTCNETPMSEADAKAAATAYVKQHLKVTSRTNPAR